MKRMRFSGLVLSTIALSGMVYGQQQEPTNRRQTQPQVRVTTRVLPHLPAQAPSRFRIGNATVTMAGWRTGFSRYGGLAVYQSFRFGGYVLDPDNSGGVLVASPFYFYPNLPPFLDASYAYADSPDNSASQATLTDNSTTNTSPDSQAGTATVQLSDSDDAVAALKHAWESDDSKAIDLLCPRDGMVKVSVADQSYSLAANDFFYLLRDGANNTKTTKLSVLDQHVDGNEIDLKMLHTFVDPSNKVTNVTQTYVLIKEKSGYVIREFGSDPYSTTSPSPTTGQSVSE